MAGTPPRRHRRSFFSSLLLLSLVTSISASSSSSAGESLGLFDFELGSALDPSVLFDDEARVPFDAEGVATWHSADRHKRALGKAWTGTTKLTFAGSTGVSAMVSEQRFDGW